MMRMNTLLTNRYIPILVAGILTVILSIGLQGSIHNLEAKLGDAVWQLIANTDDQPEKRIIVVDIDENSLAQYGSWPWSRAQMTNLLAAIRSHGPALRIIDIVFPAAAEGDEGLAQELTQMPTVLAQVLTLDAQQAPQTGDLQGGALNQQCQQNFPVANGIIANTHKLQAINAGHITPKLDSDGAVRRLPAEICYQGSAYPALSLAAISSTFSEQQKYQYKRQTEWLKPYASIESTTAGEYTLPIDQQGDILIPWYLPRASITAISAADMLSGRVPADWLKNAWVLIGATAFGGGDSIPTPQGAAVAGLEVHMQLLTAMLDNKIPYQPNGSKTIQVAWILICAILLLLADSYSSKINRQWFALLLLTVTFFAHLQLLQQSQLWLPWINSIIFITLTTSLYTARSHLQTRQQAEHLYQNLSSYLPEHVAKRIARQDLSGAISARHENVLVLYADMRNFSAWCDYLPAEQSGAILHSFYTLADQVIVENGGEIEEYVGDAVIGIWRGTAQTTQALKAACDLVARGDVLFGDTSRLEQLPPIAIGVGIEQGEVLIGSFGPSRRRVHTLLGKTLTTAMRLEAMTSELAQPIIIGENAHNNWQTQIQMQSIGQFFLPNSAKPTELFIPAISA